MAANDQIITPANLIISIKALRKSAALFIVAQQREKQRWIRKWSVMKRNRKKKKKKKKKKP